MSNTGLWDEYGRYVTSQGSFNFTVNADSGTPQTVDNGETLDIVGGVGISTVVSATNTVTINDVWDYEETLGSSDSFDKTLTDIASWDTNVKTIIIEFGIRGTVAATTDDIQIFFNNNTTVTNYHRQYNGALAGTASVTEAATSTLFRATASSSPASSFALGKIYIPMPNSTNYLKVAKVESVAYYASNDIVIDNGGVVWHTDGTSAITRIQIRTDNHPTDLLATNSYIRMKFIK